MTEELLVRFWGTRGSCAAPFPDRMEFGGNTSCVSVSCEGGLVVFDGGTGIVALGEALERGYQEPETLPEIYIFISHLHLDHVCGLPFFSMFYRRGVKIHLYGQGIDDKGFRELLYQVAGPPCWPIFLEQGKAQVYWHEVEAGGVYGLPGEGRVLTMGSDHPDHTLLYRLDIGGRSVVYGLDCEFSEPVQRAYEAFAQGCDLLIFDGMYTEEEYPRHRGFGHSTWQKGVKAEGLCQAGLVCISHHSWGRKDQELERLEAEAEKQNSHCIFARERLGIRLGASKPELLWFDR